MVVHRLDRISALGWLGSGYSERALLCVALTLLLNGAHPGGSEVAQRVGSADRVV